MSKDKSPTLTDLGNGLAIEAIDSLPKGCLTVSPNLSLANPESIHNFARFASVLEAAYNKGVESTKPVKILAEGTIPDEFLKDQLKSICKELEKKNAELEAKVAELEAQSQYPGHKPTTEISERISRYILDNPRTKSEVKGLLRSAASEADRFYTGMAAWKASAMEKDKIIAKLNKRLSNNGMNICA